MPVVMVSRLEVLLSVTPPVPVVVAETLAGVLTVPALTVVCTNPLLSEMAVEGDGVSVTPPAMALSSMVKLTVLPLMGLPPSSSTLNTTCEASVPPVPFKLIKVGVAETNWIEPAVGAVTTNDAEELAKPPLTVAVMLSVPAQPMSR